MRTELWRALIGVAMCVVVLGLIAIVTGEEYREEIHRCTHPGQENCPGTTDMKDLHCEPCTHEAHKKGCNCVMNYPCGREYDGNDIAEDRYCTPEPLY